MTIAGTQTHVMQLQRLYGLREKRALEAITEQRIELDRVLDRLQEQRSLIAGLEQELVALHQMRSDNSIHTMTATSLRAESDRRHALTQELELEVFYLPGFESDVENAQIELRDRKKHWSRIRDQIKGLEQQESKNRIKVLRSRSRKDDALLDDRKTGAQR